MKLNLLIFLLVSVGVPAEEFCIECHNRDATNGSLKAGGLHDFSGELGAKTISRRAPASYDDEAEKLYWKWKAEWKAETEDLQKLVVETGLEILHGKRKDIKLPQDDIEIKARYEALITLNKKMKDLLEKGVYEGGVVYQPLMKTYAGKEKFDTYEAQTVLNQVDLWFFEENFKHNNNTIYNLSDKGSVFLMVNGKRTEYTSNDILGLVQTIRDTSNPKVLLNGLKTLAETFYDPKSSYQNETLLYGFGGLTLGGKIRIPKDEVDDAKAIMYGYRAARQGSFGAMGVLAQGGDQYKVESYPELFKFAMVSSLAAGRDSKVGLFSLKKKDGTRVVDAVFKGFDSRMFRIAKKNNFFQDLRDEYRWIRMLSGKLDLGE